MGRVARIEPDPLTSSPAEGPCPSWSAKSHGSTTCSRGSLPGSTSDARIVPHLSLTIGEQRAVLRATAVNLRGHLIVSLALGTACAWRRSSASTSAIGSPPTGRPGARVRVPREIAKGGRAADVFFPDRLVTKLRRFRRWKRD